ncbi:Acetyl-CoA acetyltransferase [Sarcina ventriculi]|uniref:acetyl-CoA C-acetyltransferase n=1 Tax=Sarcina ventriculi TaxID=1267 RepID=UPI000D87818F|nr:acetyl-CoA C-acetyltransferase [Sarcina ventriculi]SPZ51111.1 Acetyl-CoA acetyltransferase [Sarcina ventriculi]
MSKVYIVQAKRSPIGKFLGTLAPVAPAALTAQVIKNVINESGVDVKTIDEVAIGNVLSAGHGQNIARQASIAGGIPVEVPAYTVSMVCGSGLKSVINAYTSIKAGLADVVLAGGVEVMSQAAFAVDGKTRLGNKMGDLKLKDTLLSDGLTDVFNNYHMGITAENVAKKYGLTREMQDEFSYKSQVRAIEAVDSGRFKDEIVPIEIKGKKGTVVFDTDEYPNRTTNLEKLSKLRPAFKSDGTVTAGNASGINDGATIVLVASEKAVKEQGLTPIVEITSIGQGGVDPSIMGMGPVAAINDAMRRCDVQLKDMDLVELNEAFAAQSLGVINELKNQYEEIDDEWVNNRVNVNGGAIALGHPLGASGARILTTLVHEMKKRNVENGLASLCIGGGMGVAVTVKLVK